MVYDELWPQGPRFIREEGVFSLGTDSVMLAAFPSLSGVKTVCDLGCGAGVISVIMAWEHPGVLFDGIEIQSKAAELAEKNAALNGLSDRFTVQCADLRRYREMPRLAGKYDLVVSNPPYFPLGSGFSAAGAEIAAARDERSCTLEDLCAAAAYLTRWGGRFSLVHRPERLSEIFCAMSANGLEPKRLRFVQNRLEALPSLVLIESRRGGKPGLSIEKPLVLHDETGGDSTEAKAIYHR